MADRIKKQTAFAARPTVLACPRCQCTVYECGDGAFRCDQGHSYSSDQLLPAAIDGLRQAWAGVVRALG